MTDTSGKPHGKGRPTPKRSDARGRKPRPPTKAPMSRREAYRYKKDELRITRAAQKSALRAGDERQLPAYARGPEKLVVRDAVDSRRSYGWLAFPGFIINLVSFLIPNIAVRSMLASIGFVCFFFVVTDTVAVVRRIRKGLREHFPGGTTEKSGMLIRYGIARNTQLRRRRLPPPRVEPA